MLAWLTTLETFAAAAASLEGMPRLTYGAAIGGVVVPIAVSFIMSLIPSTTFAEDWRDHLPYPVLSDEALRLYGECFDAIGTMSSIAADRSRELNDE